MKRAALALGATLLAVLLLEGVLQAASLLFRDGSRGIDPSTGRMRILCLGDSNTYGIFVERNETWPARLEQEWNSTGREPGIEVLNLGYPGTNSSQVLRDFERNLDLFQPRIVLVEIGANDYWTVPVPVDETEPWSPLDWLARHSRLYKLLYMATRSPEDERLVVEFDSTPGMQESSGSFRYGGRVFELGHTAAKSANPNLVRDLVENLTVLTRIATARHVKLVFVTYASEQVPYNLATMALKEVARATDTPLVNLRAAFRESCPAEPCPDWIFPTSDMGKNHPTARGYGLVASSVLRTLEDVVPALAPQPVGSR